MKWLEKRNFFIVAIVLVMLCLLVLGIILFNKNKDSENEKINDDIVNNYVAYVKINPSIKLLYKQTCRQNDNDIYDCEDPKVVSYELINEDANDIYKDIDLLGTSDDLYKVLNLICETARENGIVFDNVDVHTDWDKITEYIQGKEVLTENALYNIEIKNKEYIEQEIIEDNTIITYNVAFNTDVGNTIEDQKVKKGYKAIKPDNPTKSGYRFIEWQLDNNTFDFNTIINEDITLNAKWEVINNTNQSSITEPNTTPSPNTNSNNDNTPEKNEQDRQPDIPDNTPDKPIANNPTPVEDPHKGVINLNDNVMYITGDIVYECDNCISNSVINKIKSSIGITNSGLDSSYAWIRSINIPEGKYSTYPVVNPATLENLLIECGANLVGGASDFDPKLLTEDVCREYKLSCDRW